MGVVGAGDCSGAGARNRRAIAAAVVVVVGDQGAVDGDVRQAASWIVGVRVGIRDPADGLHLLHDPAQGVTGVLDVELRRATGGRLVRAHLSERAVGVGVADVPERGPGEEAVLGVPGQGEGTRLGEEAVGVVLEREPGRLVEAVTNALSNP